MAKQRRGGMVHQAVVYEITTVIEEVLDIAEQAIRTAKLMADYHERGEVLPPFILREYLADLTGCTSRIHDAREGVAAIKRTLSH